MKAPSKSPNAIFGANCMYSCELPKRVNPGKNTTTPLKTRQMLPPSCQPTDMPCLCQVFPSRPPLFCFCLRLHPNACESIKDNAKMCLCLWPITNQAAVMITGTNCEPRLLVITAPLLFSLPTPPLFCVCVCQHPFEQGRALRAQYPWL